MSVHYISQAFHSNWEPAMVESLFDRIGSFLTKKRPWYKLPTVLAIPGLLEIRNDLRKYNLHDTEEPPLAKRGPNEPVPEEVKAARTIDGSWNDLSCPMMGAAKRRFGRNFPLEH